MTEHRPTKVNELPEVTPSNALELIGMQDNKAVRTPWAALLNTIGFAAIMQAKSDAIAARDDAVPAAQTATTKAAEAETFAATAQNAASALGGTSSTSLAVGTGSKTWTTQAGKTFAVGTYVTAIASGGAVVMTGQVTAYSGTSLTVNVQRAIGSGTYNSWSISVSGPTGAMGETGPANSLTIGTVTNLVAGSTPSATITGTAPAQVLNLSLVRGADGNGGVADPTYMALLRQMEFEAALARLATPITDLPSLNLDFVGDTYFARNVAISAALPTFIAAMGGSFTRASAAWYFDATGALIQAANNVARIDRDPVTLARLGYLAESARTNGFRASVPSGAVAGSPGTMPADWSGGASNNGISREIVGVGQENGIDYIDLRFSGTASANGLLSVEFDARTAIVASAGQSWTLSNFCRLVAGSMTGLSGTLWLFDADASGTLTGGSSSAAFAPTTAALRTQRPAVTRLLADAATARVVGQWRIAYASGAVIDATIRIGLPQLEQGVFASSPIKTTGSAVTRAEEVFSLPFPAVGGTVLVVARERGETNYGRYIQMDAASDTNYLTVCRSNADGNLLLAGAGTSAGVISASGGIGRKAIAARIGATGDLRVNGGAVASGAMTVGSTTHLRVGSQVTTGQINGWIERVIIWPGVQMTDAQLLALSTLSNWG